jgi:hypothetical protein
MDRLDFFFDRWARFWLPPEEETGDRRADVARALTRTHAKVGGGTLRINTGILVIEAAETLAGIPVLPSRPLPGWLTHRPKVETPLLFLNEKLRDPPPPPSMLVQFSQAAVGPDDLVLNGGTVVTISTAKGPIWVDTLRVRPLADLLAGLRMDLCRKALALSQQRDAGAEAGQIDKALADLATQLDIDLDRLNDILDALTTANKTEIQAAAKLAEDRKPA